MRLKLKDQYRIRKEEDFAIIFDRRTEKIQKKLNRISLLEYELLKLFNGKYTKLEICNLISKNVEPNLVNEYLDAFCQKYQKYLVECTKEDIRTDIIVKKDYFKKENYASNLRLSTPLFISLVLTKVYFLL